MRTKTWCRWLVTLMAIALLTACSAPAATPPPSASTPAATQAATSAPAAASAAPSAAPEPTQRPTIKVLTEYQSIDPNADPGIQNINTLTGFNVEHYLLPSENSNEALLLDLSAGTEYDLLVLNVGHYQLAEPTGALLALDDLIAQRGPNISAAVGPMAWNSVRGADGKIYAIPTESDVPTASNPYGAVISGLALRGDLLKQAGLELPKTKADFENLLEVFKEMNNGEAPWTGNMTFMSTLASAFNIDNARWQLRDGKLVHRIETPEMKAYIEWLAGLYADGYMDVEWPINKGENITEKFTTGKAFMTHAFYWEAGMYESTLLSNIPGAEMITMSNLANDGGQRLATIASGLNVAECIPAASANAEVAFDFIEAKSDEEIFRRSYIGEEGVSYEVKDGKYYPLFPGFDMYNNVSWFVGTARPGYSFLLSQCRSRKAPEIARMYDELNDPLISDGPTNVFVDPSNYASTVSEIVQYQAAADLLEGTAYTNLITGAEPMSKWDEYVTQWKTLEGGDLMTTAINQWYADNAASIESLAK